MRIIPYNFSWYQIVNVNNVMLYERLFNSYGDALKFLEYKIHGTIPEHQTNKNQSNIRL